MHMLIINSLITISIMQLNNIRKRWDPLAKTQPSKIPADLIMYKIYAKIGMTQATVLLEIVASIYTTDPTTKLVGNFRSSTSSKKGRGGEE